MYKNCTVINKLTGEIFQAQVDTELEHVAGYPYREATAEEIANKGYLKVDEESGDIVVNTEIKLETIKQKALQQIEQKRQEPVDFQAIDIDNNVINLQSGLTDEAIAYLLKVKSKADIAGQAQVSLYNTDAMQIETRIYNQSMINQVAASIIGVDDQLEKTMVDIQNATSEAEINTIMTG